MQRVFGGTAVAIFDAELFLANWRQIFLPSRDDVLVLHNLESHIALYGHEDLFGVGRRVSQRPWKVQSLSDSF